MDAFSVIQGADITFSHLSVSWAFVADIDIESERFRCLGTMRYTLAAILRLLRLRTYTGVLYMLPPGGLATTVGADGLCGPARKYTSCKDPTYHSWPVKIESTFQMLVACNLPWIGKVTYPHGC